MSFNNQSVKDCLEETVYENADTAKARKVDAEEEDLGEINYIFMIYIPIFSPENFPFFSPFQVGLYLSPILGDSSHIG